MKALRFILLVIIIDCGSAFVFGLILLLVGFGQNEKSERGGEGRGGEEVLPRAIIGILWLLLLRNKIFEGVVFVASVIKMHEIRINLIVFTHWWLEKPIVKPENR